MQATQESLSASEMREKLPKVGDGKAPLPFVRRAWICNLMDIRWSHDFDYGTFAIEPRRKGERFQVTEIGDRISITDHGEKNRTEKPIGALDIAHDLVRIFNTTAGSTDEETGAEAFVGVFVIKGPEPTAKELAEGEEKLKAFCKHYVAVADRDFADHHKPNFIPGFARRAAEYLDLDAANHPWMVQASAEMIRCPMCTTSVMKEAAICPNCKFELDPAKVERLTKTNEPVAEARGRGNTKGKEGAEGSHQSPAGDRSKTPDSRT